MNTEANPIPDEYLKAARDAYLSAFGEYGQAKDQDIYAAIAKAIHDAVMAERERWSPASTYFERYCQDEADATENCISEQQHRDAKAFAAVVRGEG